VKTGISFLKIIDPRRLTKAPSAPSLQQEDLAHISEDFCVLEDRTTVSTHSRARLGLAIRAKQLAIGGQPVANDTLNFVP
jgi:hypothetical protein